MPSQPIPKVVASFVAEVQRRVEIFGQGRVPRKEDGADLLRRARELDAHDRGLVLDRLKAVVHPVSTSAILEPDRALVQWLMEVVRDDPRGGGAALDLLLWVFDDGSGQKSEAHRSRTFCRMCHEVEFLKLQPDDFYASFLRAVTSLEDDARNRRLAVSATVLLNDAPYCREREFAELRRLHAAGEQEELRASFQEVRRLLEDLRTVEDGYETGAELDALDHLWDDLHGLSIGPPTKPEGYMKGDGVGVTLGQLLLVRKGQIYKVPINSEPQREWLMRMAGGAFVSLSEYIGKDGKKKNPSTAKAEFEAICIRLKLDPEDFIEKRPPRGCRLRVPWLER